MKINYWSCEFADYDESYDPETGEENRYYNCTHPNGHGTCDLANKFNNSTDNCEILEDKNP